MTFEEVLGQAMAMLQRRGRVTYRTLPRQLPLDEAARQASPAVEPATSHYRQALALAEELGLRPLQAHCHLGLGTLYTKLGWQEQARAALSAAVTLYRAMDMTFWLSQAEAALTQAEER